MAKVNIENCPSCQILIDRYGRDSCEVCPFCGHLVAEKGSCTCTTNQTQTKMLIYQRAANRPNEIDIFIADGGVASLTPSACGKDKYLLADLYQSRLDRPIKNYEEIWNRLGEGKLYNEEYKPARVTKKVVAAVVWWLGFDIDRVQIEKLVGISDEEIVKRINDLIKH